ncbi:MAG: Holliday junction resolvase Hjc [archaeon]|jgi:Holliday junction resolvase
MKNKQKGSNAERELLFDLFNKGFAVSRVAGSGSSQLPTPDVLAFKAGKAIAIECKTKKGEYLNIRQEQVEELQLWEKLSGLKALVAWRLTKGQWFFIGIDKLNKTKKAYSIKREEIKEKGTHFDKFIAEFESK